MNLEFTLRKATMNNLFYKMKFSLDEINTKHPTRNDLIESMSKSLVDVFEMIKYLDHIEMNNRVLDKRIYSLELENMQLKQENRHLSKHLENLNNEL
jgi:hypothetical protein